MGETADHLKYEVRDNVALITLTRPEALNALSLDMIDGIRAAVKRATADDAVFALVFTGEGRGFSAGMDMGVLQNSTGAAGNPRPHFEAGDGTPALFGYLLGTPKPVICAINGVAAGGGFVLAMMSDLRFAAEEATFITVFSKRGLIAEHAMSWLLPRQIGTSRALDLLWSSRKVDAQEALRIGLVDRVVPAADLVQAAIDYVAMLKANVAPRAVATIKTMVYRHLSMDFVAASEDCERIMRAALKHPDAVEGGASFVERRPPAFAPVSEGFPQ
ncbi:MAG: enoyl-CoA hydratase-related protein [Phenylobacterium sp.]|uniref:enoyl-CoA hydratase-related protein n=1 Tax=Phenylobacterium sp. TaxID=1871053 RepID=UPI002734F325|nr:enoyl-CoA hydratase-related protein [Phenylobacterium sp.]MDP3173849.1 enoyl-CoA hydratase-related protein [Phenylobacterium sp.]